MIITQLEDGTIIEQDRGTFDDYCVYVTKPGEDRFAPRDVQYFQFFIEKAERYTPEKIYSDYEKIYNKTDAIIRDEVIDEIRDEIVLEYDRSERNEFALWYIVIYMGMVAKENKRNAVLQKRIKRLGMYQILFNGMSARKAANYSKGRRVGELGPLCKQNGF